MAVACSQTTALWREEGGWGAGEGERLCKVAGEVEAAKGALGAESPVLGGSSCGQAARGHPRCWEWIRAPACGELQQRLELELRLAGRELTTVRRAALHQFLRDEHQQHQRELRRLGRAAYVERL